MFNIFNSLWRKKTQAPAAAEPKTLFPYMNSREREFFQIQLDAAKGQSVDTIKAVFEEIGFDMDRPRIDLGDVHIGYSCHIHPESGTVEAYLFAAEARAIAAKGYAVARLNDLSEEQQNSLNGGGWAPNLGLGA